jgi:hypothetical protein
MLRVFELQLMDTRGNVHCACAVVRASIRAMFSSIWLVNGARLARLVCVSRSFKIWIADSRECRECRECREWNVKCWWLAAAFFLVFCIRAAEQVRCNRDELWIGHRISTDSHLYRHSPVSKSVYATLLSTYLFYKNSTRCGVRRSLAF